MIAPLRSAFDTFTADADGWISPPSVASGAAWYANGGAQRLTYLCDQNNVIDDAHVYWAEIAEERTTPFAVASSSIDGVAVRERMADCRLASTANIAGITGAMNIDGVAVVTGDRILVKDQTQTYQNGIWIANTAGAWTRAVDFDTPEKITPGAYLKVVAGNTQTDTFWQVNDPRPFAIGALGVGYPITFGALVGAGNVYHSIKSYFDGIVDMRWP